MSANTWAVESDSCEFLRRGGSHWTEAAGRSDAVTVRERQGRAVLLAPKLTRTAAAASLCVYDSGLIGGAFSFSLAI